MTPQAMRALARRERVEAASLEAAAGQLRAISSGLAGMLAPLAGMSRRVWMGPAAAQFEVMAVHNGRLVDDQAVRLAGIAGEFLAEAAGLRRAAAALDAAAAGVATVVSGGVP